MTNKDKTCFFKEYYEQQNIRKEKIYEQFFYYIGLLTIQLGFIGYYLLNLPNDNESFLWWIFVLLGAIALVIYAIVGNNIYKFITNGEYGYLPYPNEIKSYLNTIDNSNLDNTAKDNEFQSFLLDGYLEISQKNTILNEKRQSKVIQMRNWLILNVVILFLMFIPYFFLMGNQINSHKVILLNDKIKTDTNFTNTFKVEIINDRLIFNSTDNKIFKIKIINDRLKIEDSILNNFLQNITLEDLQYNTTIHSKDTRNNIMSDTNNSDSKDSNQTDINQSQIVSDNNLIQDSNTDTDHQQIQRPNMRYVTESFDPTNDNVIQKNENDN